uniref:C-C motif chemokine n=1 Tax=Poecilia formosa TaxID=48698 RepID=A0A096M4S7_POEFO
RLEQMMGVLLSIWSLIANICGCTDQIGYRMSKTCCTRYSKKPIPSENIKGYREQVTLEHCRINAIIFYTTNNHEICTSPNDDWVKEALSSLSSKLKMMSQNTDGKKM